MKSALWKDILREIRKSKGRFFSIMMIVAIGVAFFAGVKGSVPDMKYTADKYFDDYQAQDIQLVSSVGFTKEDVEEIRKVEGVEGVHPTYTKDVVTNKDARQYTLKVMGMPSKDKQGSKDDVNKLRLVEGRFPEKSGECVVEKSTLTEGDFHIGDTITLSSGNNEDIKDSLKTDTYKIVGTVYSPVYLSDEKGSTTVGSGTIDYFIVVLDDEFTMDYYTEVGVTVSGADKYNSYEDAYFDVTDNVKNRLQTLGNDRVELRTKEIQDTAKKEYEKGEKEYEQSKKTFDEEMTKAQAKLDASKDTLLVSEATLNSSKLYAQQEVANAKSQIAMLESALTQVQAKQKELSAQIQSKVDAANARLDELYAQKKVYEDIISYNENRKIELQAKLDAASSEEEKKLYQMQIAVCDETIQTTKELEKTLEDSISTVRGTLQEIQKQLDDVDNYSKELTTMLADAKQELKDKEALAKEQSASGKAQIKEGKQKLQEGQKELLRQKTLGEAQLELAKQKLDKAKAQLSNLPEPQWYVLDRHKQYAYMDYGSVADRMDGIAKVFPLFFFLVAALVCLTTMTRMVDEQRGNIGTMKALGYSQGAIALKYIVYAFVAGVAGSILGCSLGMYIFPLVIFNAWNLMYNLPPLSFVLQPALMFGASALVIGVTILAAFAAVYKELMEVPSQLMRPKAPKEGKKIFLERIPFLWSSFSFTQKVTARNIFRYKKRFFMTVIGIAGCSALLVAGFGIQDSISDIVSKQYEEIFQYDAVITLDDGATILEKEDVIDSMKEDTRFKEVLGVTQKPVTITSDSGEDSAVTVVSPGDIAEFSDFTSLRHRGSKELLPLDDDGALISEKLAMNLGVKKGDVISLKDADGISYDVKINDIVENYVGHYIYMSPIYYKEVFKERQSNNAVYTKLASNDEKVENELAQEWMGKDHVSSVSIYSGMAETFQDTLDSLGFVVVVLVIAAGLLAFVVLYNLTNVNISERIREIATIKVLGFYDKEVSAYVYRENIILTIIGALAGLLLGIGLHHLIMGLAEMENVMFGRNIDGISFVVSFFITMLFACIVNLVMYRKLKNVAMVESLKSVE